MLEINKLCKSYGARTLFNDVNLRLGEGDRVGLVGPNGAGKTTLFSIILGENHSDEGTVQLERGTKLGFLPQESAPVGDETVLELATAITPEFSQLFTILKAHPDEQSPEHLGAMERLTELGIFSLQPKAKRILAGLAFRSEDFDQPAKTLSGGWIMRAHLARLLVMEPQLLMLDEPTNHLDLETLGWFENYLKNYPGAILTISHDRSFLNAICDGIAEMRNGKLRRYTGNYDQYLEQRAQFIEQQRAAYENQQREIAHLQDFINRFRAKASKATQAQARLKQLEKMERIEPPEPEESTIAFKFPQPPRSGQRVATLTHVKQAYGDHVVYENLSLEIEKDERIILVGPNGTGKSTLLKILAEQVPIESGTRELGLNVSVGYFSQQRVDTLDLSNSVLDEACTGLRLNVSEQTVRTLLGSFLFRGDDVFKPVSVLSGGEKSRLALVKLLLDPPNLLLLDEPTTHLDMASIDMLIHALSQYEGTLICVSHDVHFIRALSRRVVKIESGKITNFPGDYDYYLHKSGTQDAQAGLIAGLSNARPESTREPSAKSNDSRSPKERRAQRAQERKKIAEQRKVLEKIEGDIMQLEAQQNEISQKLSDPTAYADPEQAKELNQQAARISKYLEEKNYEWERLAETIEAMQE